MLFALVALDKPGQLQTRFDNRPQHVEFLNGLGKTLKLKITAEGVETQAQAEFLSEIACHQLQGFYFARPLDHIDLPHYLLTHVLPRAPALKAEAEAKLSARAG